MKKKKKLIQQTSKNFLQVSSILMIVSTICLYFVTKTLLLNEIEEELSSTKARVETALKENSNNLFLSPVIEVHKVEKLHQPYLKDTLIFDPSQNEMELFRELSSFKKINTINYQITIRTLIVETNDILIAIIVSNILILLITFIILFYFNKKKNTQVWGPFFINLQQIKQFSLSSENPIKLIDSEIIEFAELNKEVHILTKKVQADYKNLKQFTEDVSHEMQTPLAIIQAKIENFINGDNLSNEQFNNLTSVQKDIQRLSQLNKKLTLLSNIENNQFTSNEIINITDVLEEVINDFKEITQALIIYKKKSSIPINADPHLARILCNNLISNAIKYGTEGKTIEVIAENTTVSVSNYGENSLQQPNKIFGRYYREESKVKSTGLGLTIVKKICDLHGFQVFYEFQKQQHIFKIDFNTSHKKIQL